MHHRFPKNALAPLALGLLLACAQASTTATSSDPLGDTAAESTRNTLDGIPDMGPRPGHLLRLDCTATASAARDGDRPPAPDGRGPDGAAPPEGAGRPEHRGGHEGGPGGGRGGHLLWVYDRSGDGTLDDTERAEMEADRLAGCEARVAQLIAAYDADGDGTLSESELATAQAEIDAQLAAHRAEAIATYDSNGDGQLDQSERAVMREARRALILAAYDGNADGTLDESEQAALAAAIRADLRAGNPPGFSLSLVG